MELTADTVHWKVVRELHDRGRLEGVLKEEEEFEGELGGENPPWSSDSSIQYSEVVESLAILKARMTQATKEKVEALGVVLNEDFQFPADLGTDINEELVAGSLSPESVQNLSNLLVSLDYEELEKLFDTMPAGAKSQLQIARFGSRKGFVSYLEQWRDFFHAAAARQEGIFFHLG